MASYSSKQGDMVDAICAKYYPDVPLDIALSAVFEVNAGLAAYGPILPDDVTITLPEITLPSITGSITLW